MECTLYKEISVVGVGVVGGGGGWGEECEKFHGNTNLQKKERMVGRKSRANRLWGTIEPTRCPAFFTFVGKDKVVLIAKMAPTEPSNSKKSASRCSDAAVHEQRISDRCAWDPSPRHPGGSS